jgi:hypothetical protein
MKSLNFAIKEVLVCIFFLIYFYFSIGSCFSASGNIGINLDLFQLSVYNPQEIVYRFGIGDVPVINLSVYSNRNATFYYTLREVVNDTIIHNHVSFTPNTTFIAVFGLNELTVFANDSSGNVKNKSINFFVLNYNSPPIIQNISSSIYVCEDRFLSYFFNVTDYEEDNVASSIVPTYPDSPFYVSLRYYFSSTISVHEIFSGALSKRDAGGINGSKTYLENISVSDGEYNDNASLNITVIGINHAPVMENISNQYFRFGETFYKQLIVNDVENGNSLNGNLSFNISFTNRTLFNVTPTGLINFAINSSSLGEHNVTICVTDRGINAHQNISLCGQTGSNLSDCKNFLLSISGCGDGTCNGGETCSSCASDCGECSTGGVGGGGGGGGKAMPNLFIGDIIIEPEFVLLNIRKGTSVRQALIIRNTKQQIVNLSFSLSDSLTNIALISARNLTLRANEQRLFDLDFFCNDSIATGVYTGKIIVTYGEFTKKIPIAFNVNEKDTLFDVIIYADKKKITAGKDLPFHLQLYNLGRLGIINASIEYYIKDFDGKIISKIERNVSVNTNATLDDKFFIPKNLDVGRYVIGINFKYDVLTGISSDSFEVVSNRVYFYVIILILILIIIIIIIYIKIRNNYRKKALKSLSHI